MVVLSDPGLRRAMKTSGDPSSDCSSMKHPLAGELVTNSSVTLNWPLPIALAVALWTSNVAVKEENIHLHSEVKEQSNGNIK